MNNEDLTVDYCNKHRLDFYKTHAARNFCCVYPSKYHATTWEYLLEAAYEYRKPRPPSTPRQQEIQKLWQQLGTLERTRANILNIIKLYSSVPNHRRILTLNMANEILYYMIQETRQAMKPKSKVLNETGVDTPPRL